MDWIEIVTEDDIKEFNSKVGHFHDACLNEILLSTGNPMDDSKASLLFYGGWGTPDVFEMEFYNEVYLKVNKINAGKNYMIMFDTQLRFIDGEFFWSFDGEEAEHEYSYVIVKSKNVRYRCLSDKYLDGKDFYVKRG